MRHTEGKKNYLQFDKLSGFSPKNEMLFSFISSQYSDTTSKFHGNLKFLLECIELCISACIWGLCMSTSKGFSRIHLCSSGQMGVIYERSFKMLNT